MSTFPRAGRKVRFHPFERVDLPDIDAIGDLPTEALATSLAGLVGEIDQEATGASFPLRGTAQHGLLSPLRYNATGQIVTFDAMRFGWVVESPSPVHAVSAEYDPANDPDTTAVLSLSLYAGQTPFIWARRVLSDTDTAARRFVDDSTGEEFVQAVPTRTKVSVALGISLSGNPDSPPKGTGWVRIARAIYVPADNVTPGDNVILEPRHMFDRYDPDFEADFAVGKRAKYYAETRSAAGAGLNDALPAIFAVLSKLRDGRWKFNPDTFQLDGAQPGDVLGWRSLLDDETVPGLAQLEGSVGLADNINRINAGRTAYRDGILSTVVCRTDTVTTGTFETFGSFLVPTTASFTNGPTDNGGDGHWWRCDFGAPISTFPQTYPNASSGDPVQPNVFGNCMISGVIVVPLHNHNTIWNDDDLWNNNDPGVTPEISVDRVLPSGVGSSPLKVKVRFRSLENNHPIKAPKWGWMLLVIGRPMLPA